MMRVVLACFYTGSIQTDSAVHVIIRVLMLLVRRLCVVVLELDMYVACAVVLVCVSCLVGAGG